MRIKMSARVRLFATAFLRWRGETHAHASCHRSFRDHVNVQAANMDQFFTPPSVARELVDDLCIPEDVTILEPSVGTGSFWRCLPPTRRVGFEIDKTLADTQPGVIWGDFLKQTAASVNGATWAVGNPPFSSVPSTTAQSNKRSNRGSPFNWGTRFINHCATIGCDTVAFILSAGASKPAMHNRICRQFRCVTERPLGVVNFQLGSGSGSVKVRCMWQVWKRQPEGWKRAMHTSVKRERDGTLTLPGNDVPLPFKMLTAAHEDANVVVGCWGNVGKWSDDRAVVRSLCTRYHYARGRHPTHSTWYFLSIPEDHRAHVAGILGSKSFMDAMRAVSFQSPRLRGGSVSMDAFVRLLWQHWAPPPSSLSTS